MGTVFGREPAMIVAFVQVLLILGISFGLSLSEEQKTAILAAVTVGLALIVRQSVYATPNVQKLANQASAGLLATDKAGNVDIGSPPKGE